MSYIRPRGDLFQGHVRSATGNFQHKRASTADKLPEEEMPDKK